MAEQKIKKYTQTVMEEIANSITHGLGFGFSVAGLTILVVFASMDGDPWRIIAFTIYGKSTSEYIKLINIAKKNNADWIILQPLLKKNLSSKECFDFYGRHDNRRSKYCTYCDKRPSVRT